MGNLKDVHGFHAFGKEYLQMLRAPKGDWEFYRQI